MKNETLQTTETPMADDRVLGVVHPILGTYMGRKTTKRIEFNEEGTFQSHHAAIRWCKENGYSYGSMDGHNPIALWNDDSVISKWHNLSNEEKRTCDGVLESQREGKAIIIIFAK
jgi:hypothetical protein